MPPSEPKRIFISYARKDGAELAKRLQASLTANGFDAWLDTQRIGGGRVWSVEIEREIDTRQVTIALLSPGSHASEICRAEQLRALDKGNRVIPVLATKGGDRPLYLYARQHRDFTEDLKYDISLGELLADIRGDATAILSDSHRKTRVTYLTAPPRVANYLQRPEALHALRNALFAEDHRQPIALTALAGMGGIGKTVMAKALIDDEIVQRAFPDGIVWITAGKERKRDFIEEMRQVAEVLGNDTTDKKVSDWADEYRIRIANKAALIVVDDVWSKSDIEPLLAESRRSRFLFTTRDAAIGRFVGAHEHRADLLDVAQSRELLASWANLPVAQLPATADEVIVECGRLPIALSVVGAMLRDADAEFWRDTLELLRKADLSAIQEQLPEGQESFFKAVEVSFQSLKQEMQERYKALAVLLEEMAAPLSILQTLWNANEAEARRISRNLVDRSLAQREIADESIRLHDLQLDYVRAQYTDNTALQLIHGALRLASHVIVKDPEQFASQMSGRLLPHGDMPAIAAFAERVASGAQKPWLRPLHPALHPPGSALVRILEGHKGEVHSVAVTQDGQRAVSASYDQTLKVWDIASGRELLTLAGHTDPVYSVAVSGDGRLVVSASMDSTLKVWELGSGRELRTLTGHGGSVNAVAVTPDGQHAVSASSDQTLKVSELASGCELRTLTGHTGEVWAVAVTPDGQRAVSGSGDQTLKVWDLDSGRELRTLTGHTNWVRGVALSGDGQRAVSASEDQTLKVWEVSSGRELHTLTGHTDWVRDVALSGDGRMAISASNDKTLKVWEVSSGRELRTLTGHTNWVYGVALTADRRLVVSASADKTLKVWDVGSAREMRTLSGHTGVVWGVALSGDGRLAVSASADKTLKVWDVDTARQLRTLTGHSDVVLDVALSTDRRTAVSTSEDKTLKVWELDNGHELHTLKGHSGPVSAVALSADGRLAVSASYDQTLKVWELGSGRELRTFAGHSGPVSAVALSADGRLAVSASSDQTLKVWEVESGRELRTLAGHARWVRGVAVSSDGRLVVSVSLDTTLKVWDADTGRELRTLTDHTREVRRVALSGNGQLAVSVSEDQMLKVWEVESGVLLATFTCDSAAYCCAFSDTLRLIIAGDQGGHIHFLRLEEPHAKG